MNRFFFTFLLGFATLVANAQLNKIEFQEFTLDNGRDVSQVVVVAVYGYFLLALFARQPKLDLGSAGKVSTFAPENSGLRQTSTRDRKGKLLFSSPPLSPSSLRLSCSSTSGG